MEDATVSYLCQQEKYDYSCYANDIDERDYSRRKVMQNYFYGQTIFWISIPASANDTS